MPDDLTPIEPPCPLSDEAREALRGLVRALARDAAEQDHRDAMAAKARLTDQPDAPSTP